MNLFTEQKETHWLREQTYGSWKKGWGKGVVREFGIDRMFLAEMPEHFQRPKKIQNYKHCFPSV